MAIQKTRGKFTKTKTKQRSIPHHKKHLSLSVLAMIAY